MLRRALDGDIDGQSKEGRSKRTWKKQVEEESENVALRRENEFYRSKWSVGVNQIAARLMCIWLPSLVEDTT